MKDLRGNAALCASCNTIPVAHSVLLDFDEFGIHWYANYLAKWCKAFMFNQNLFISPESALHKTQVWNLLATCARINKASPPCLTLLPSPQTPLVMCVRVLHQASLPPACHMVRISASFDMQHSKKVRSC